MPADSEAWKNLRWNFKYKGDAGIIPVQQHLGGVKIFENNETDEFKDLFVDRMIPVHGSKTQTRKIQCDSYNDTMIKAGSIFSASAGDPAIGKILCKSMYAESKYTSTESSVSIHLLHILHPKFQISLPEEPEIHKYLDPDFRERLNDIRSKEDARDLVEKMGGGFYITSATFGGMRFKNNSAQVQKTSYDNTKSYSGFAKFDTGLRDTGPVASASIEKNKQAAGSNNAKDEDIVDELIGGVKNPDEGIWIKSIEGKEEIVNFTLARISQLLPAPTKNLLSGPKERLTKRGRFRVFGAKLFLLEEEEDPADYPDKNHYPDDYPDNRMKEEWLEKKEWLDESITDYANARYAEFGTNIQRVKNRVKSALEKISENDVFYALKDGHIKRKNINDIVDKPVKELINKIKDSPAMTRKEIEDELGTILRKLDDKQKQHRHFHNQEKAQVYKEMHGKVKSVQKILSPT